MAGAKALGAKRVIAVDIQQDRLDFAHSYIATDKFLPPKPEKDESKVDYGQRATDELKKSIGVGDEEVDLSVDASGAEPCICMSLFLLKRRGVHVQVYAPPSLAIRAR